MNKNENIPIQEILTYELSNNPIAKYISNKFLQNLMSIYMANKVRRKYTKYLNRKSIYNAVRGNYNDYIKELNKQVFNLNTSLLEDNIEVQQLAKMLYLHLVEIENTNHVKFALNDLIRQTK